MILIKITSTPSSLPRVHQILANTKPGRYTKHERVIFNTPWDIAIHGLYGVTSISWWIPENKGVEILANGVAAMCFTFWNTTSITIDRYVGTCSLVQGYKAERFYTHLYSVSLHNKPSMLILMEQPPWNVCITHHIREIPSHVSIHKLLMTTSSRAITASAIHKLETPVICWLAHWLTLPNEWALG